MSRHLTFQGRVQPWMLQCFGPEIAADKIERNHRFLEEALELVQSIGCTQSEAHQLVDYVFGRPVGDTPQEVGGVMVTLAALCLANDIDMHEAGDVELARVWDKIDKIRAKQAAKPKHSPLAAESGAIPSTHLPGAEQLISYPNGGVHAFMFHFAVPEIHRLDDIAREQGFDVQFLSLADDPSAQDLATRWLEDGTDVVEQWQPHPPEGWRFASKYDTEDGVYACFIRRQA